MKSTALMIGLLVALSTNARAEPAGTKALSDSLPPKTMTHGINGQSAPGCCSIDKGRQKRSRHLPQRSAR